MAKVGFWLKGARGKLGNAVLSQTPNGTIAREIVTPSNPQTNKQMFQRAIFATIATAAKTLKPLVNHSFYGIKSGEASVREFRKLNLHLLRNKVAADIASGDTVTDGIAMLAPKGYKFIVPNQYQISSGTLASPALRVEEDSDEGNSLTLFGNGANILQDITRRDLIKKLFGVGPGEQLTLCYITVNCEYPIYQYPDPTFASSVGFKCGENQFHAERLVFSESGGWDDIITLRTMDLQVVLNAIAGVLVAEKSDDAFLQKIKDAIQVEPTGTAGSYTACAIQWDHTVIIANFAKAGAVIRSKQQQDGTWNYSTAFLTIVPPSDGEGDYGIASAYAVNSYFQSASVGADNDPFLDEGGSGGSLSDFNEGGGSTPSPTLNALQKAVEMFNRLEERTGADVLTVDDIIARKVSVNYDHHSVYGAALSPADVAQLADANVILVSKSDYLATCTHDHEEVSGWEVLRDSDNYPFSMDDMGTGWEIGTHDVLGSVAHDSSLDGLTYQDS